MSGPTGGKIARKDQLAEFKTHIENGEFDCHKSGCSNTATQVKTVTRRFAIFTEVVDVPVCDEHTDYHF
jgi:hypothetical protein